jgi:hypothetical protein
VSNGDPTHFGLTAGLEGDCPNQVVTLINEVTEFVTPCERHTDQDHDEGKNVIRFVRPTRQLSNAQLLH